MEALIVGDMHVVPEELADCSKLLDFITTLCEQKSIKEVWFMGDQHHTHAIMRLEVLNWWKVAIRCLKSHGLKVTLLVGNHDQASPGSTIHAMMAYEGLGVAVIDKPTEREGVLFVPYMHDEEEFVKACRDFAPIYEEDRDNTPYLEEGAPTVICHQTFNGATYENGFLASDGFSIERVPQKKIISGHIHTAQEFSKLWYVGAPRWRSLSDANVPRALWHVKFKNGELTERTPYSTGDVCRQIVHMDDTPDAPVALPLDPKHQYRIDIRGPQAWCQERKMALKAAGARIRTFPDQVSYGRVRESDGIAVALKKYVEQYQPKYGTPRDTLEAMLKERVRT